MCTPLIFFPLPSYVNVYCGRINGTRPSRINIYAWRKETCEGDYEPRLPATKQTSHGYEMYRVGNTVNSHEYLCTGTDTNETCRGDHFEWIEIWNHQVTLQEQIERCWSLIPQNQPINQPNSQKVIRFVVTRGGGRRKGYWMKTVRRYKLPGVNIKMLCKYDEYK